MSDGNQPLADPVARCAVIGGVSSVTAVVLSVAILSSTGVDEKCGMLLPIIWVALLSIILLPLGSLVGAIVGLFLRRRGGGGAAQ